MIKQLPDCQLYDPKAFPLQKISGDRRTTAVFEGLNMTWLTHS
jgi:hypothetical protein